MKQFITFTTILPGIDVDDHCDHIDMVRRTQWIQLDYVVQMIMLATIIGQFPCTPWPCYKSYGWWFTTHFLEETDRVLNFGS